MWDSRAERTADTIAWFPRKVHIFIASSTDLVLAGLHDIHYALTHPSNGSALAPTTDSTVAALNQLSEVLTSLCTAAPPTRPAADPAPPPLRVTNVPRPATALPAPPPPPVFLVPPLPAVPPLRVACVPRPFPALPAPPPPTQLASVLPRVPVVPVIPAASPLRVPLPAQAPLTYAAATRKYSRQRKPTWHLTAATTLIPPRAVPTRSALHGNAFNPDTGQIADYPELSRCSDGAHWINSCSEEFGRLCQGYGADMPTGTNTSHGLHSCHGRPTPQETNLPPRSCRVLSRQVKSPTRPFHHRWQPDHL